jgi:hypothetical protein
MLLWEECKLNHPMGIMYTQFFNHTGDSRNTTKYLCTKNIKPASQSLHL